MNEELGDGGTEEPKDEPASKAASERRDRMQEAGRGERAMIEAKTTWLHFNQTYLSVRTSLSNSSSVIVGDDMLWVATHS